MKPELKKWLEAQSKKPAMESADVTVDISEVKAVEVEATVETPEEVKEDVPVVEETVGTVSAESADELTEEEKETEGDESKEESEEDEKSDETKEEVEPVEEVIPEVAPASVVEETPPTEEVPVEETQVTEVAETETPEVVEETPEKLVTDEVVVEETEDGSLVTDAPVIADIVEETSEPKDESVAGTITEEVTEVELTPAEDVLSDVSEEGAQSAEAVLLDDVTASMVEKQGEIEDVADDIETLEESQVAMERYIEVLKEAEAEGGLSQHAAAIMRINLESFEKKLGIEKQITPSVEAFGGVMSQRAATTVSIEGVKEVVELIKKAIAAAWAKLKEFVQEMMTKFKLQVGTYEKKIAALEKAAKAIDKDAKPTEFSVSNPGMLMADGEWFGNEKGCVILAGIAGVIFNKYPRELAVYVHVLSDGLDDKILFNPNSKFVDIFRGEGIKFAFDHLPSDAVLFGNRKIIISGGTESNPSVHISLTEADGKQADSTYNVTSDSVVGINKRLEALSKVVKEMNGFPKHQTEIKTTIEKVTKAIEAKAKTINEQENASLATKRLVEIAKAVEVLDAKYTGVISYVGKVLAAQLALIEREIASYK